MSKITTTVFSTSLLDKEFCKECGALLNFDGYLTHETILSCTKCNHKLPLKIFDGITNTSVIHFNNPEKEKTLRQQNKLKKLKGPIVDRVCPKCGSEQMYYFTLQTRSADEGQTVFYTCIKCSKQEIEYS